MKGRQREEAVWPKEKSRVRGIMRACVGWVIEHAVNMGDGWMDDGSTTANSEWHAAFICNKMACSFRCRRSSTHRPPALHQFFTLLTI